MARYACERCGAAFESDDARCPTCLRKSSVRAVLDSDDAEAMQLARGEQTPKLRARALAIGAALVIATLLTELAMRALEVFSPSSVGAAWSVATCALFWAALTTEPTRPWTSFARGTAIALLLGAWAFVSTALARAMGGGLSLLFTLVLAVCVFSGAVVPWLLWARRREPETKPSPGKWR